MIIDAAELKRRYLQRIKGVRDNKVYIGPQSVGLDITHVCNLTCRYCWSQAPGNPHHFKKAKCFSWERFLAVVSECTDLDVDEILIGGFGEPTRHPLFRDMMRHLEQQPSYIKLYTNGTFPLDYCLDVIRGDHVNIHLSAADRKQYHDLHGKDLFDHVVNNIERLVSLRDATKPKFRIMINYIINAVNINQKQKMQKLASQLGVNEVYFEEVAHVSDREIALAEGSIEGKGKM
ncbi:radical SAM protein, partial [bacterium]|nr:radical SAM protein [bacterium]